MNHDLENTEKTVEASLRYWPGAHQEKMFKSMIT
jgi:hypothetical protein